MIIAMLISMSGGRDDDRPWPPSGADAVPFEVTDEEGAGLVKWGHAVDVSKQFKLDDIPPHLRLPQVPHVAAPAPVSLPAETAAGPADNSPDPPEAGRYDPPDAGWEDPPAEPADLAGGDGYVNDGPGGGGGELAEPEDSGPEDDGEPPEPPKPADPKQAWFDYATATDPGGMAGKKIDDVTKADLMSKYGGRLLSYNVFDFFAAVLFLRAARFRHAKHQSDRPSRMVQSFPKALGNSGLGPSCSGHRQVLRPFSLWSRRHRGPLRLLELQARHRTWKPPGKPFSTSHLYMP